MLTESAYHIGFCYVELKLNEKAYKYLDFALKTGGNKILKYKIELINCMTALNDIGTYGLVRTFREELHEKEEGEFTNEDHFFAEFLFRREIYNLIEMKEYKRAKDMLQALLNNDPENDFALSEMDYLKENKLI